jgi:hypothetical protein
MLAADEVARHTQGEQFFLRSPIAGDASGAAVR